MIKPAFPCSVTKPNFISLFQKQNEQVASIPTEAHFKSRSEEVKQIFTWEAFGKGMSKAK